MQKLAILGGHTALARVLREELADREIEAEVISATLTEHLAPDLHAIDQALLESADLVVMAFGGGMATKLADGARLLGKPVLDLIGLVDESPNYVWPSIEDTSRLEAGKIHCVPEGLTISLAAALKALPAQSARHVSITAMESAASRDQAGMDELSEQVRAVFTMSDPEPKQFPVSLAFNAIPQDLDIDPLPDELMKAQLRAGLPEYDSASLSITRVWTPTFSVDTAVVDIFGEGWPEEKELQAAFAGGKGIRWVEDERLHALAASDRSDTLLGHLRVEEGHLRLWLAADRLRRGGASLAVTAIDSHFESFR